MKSIRIEFLDNTPDGPRLVRDNNWAGECILCARSRIDDALSGDLFDVPGVYVLVGTSEVREGHFRNTIYIGQGDSVQDRLQSHLKNKDFWRTAVVFRRQTGDLHAGNIKYLEARLIQLASAEGNCVLANSVSPSLVSLPSAEQADTEEFLERMLFYLAALGFDFFTPDAPPPQTEQNGPGGIEVEMPVHLRSIIEQIKPLLVAWPDATFYSTKTPDYRAKVTRSTDFRVFARLKFRKSGIKLQLKDVCDFVITGVQDITGHVKDKVVEAHDKAKAYLESRT